MRVAHAAHLGRGRLRERAPVAVERARFDRRQGVHRGQAALFDQVDQGAGIGMKHRFSCVAARRLPMIADRLGDTR